MSLIQLALAAEEYFQQMSGVRLTGAQCVRTKYIHAACARCVEHCPTGAITLDNHLPVLDENKCIKCGVCLHVCPVGAFEHSDGLYNLLNCAECLVDRERVDIACAYHPAAATTDRAVDGVIQTGYCLSELGASTYIGLKAVGVTEIRVRQDACQTCPLRVLQPQIAQSIRRAQRILAAFDMEDELVIVEHTDPAWRKRPLYQSNNPPVSRRRFLTLFTAGAPSHAQAIASAPDDDQTASGKVTSRERQRLLAALRFLIAPDAGTTLDTDDFVQFVVHDTCTACGLCERVCPTGALRVEKADAAFAVNFAPHLCTHCGVCVTYCEPGALLPAGHPSIGDVLEGAVMPLHTGTLRQCTRCRTLFASQTDEDLCEVCRHRRTGQLPDTILSKLPPAARERLRPS